ncbi:MAG: adenosylmethionine decarboxylase [Myxococcales bacterium]|nr:adenosylmethionine decarboxylase [Myxococcales bacterium]
MKTLSRHLIAELYGCPAERLDDLALAAEALRAAAAAIGATVVGEAFHRYAPQGVSGTLLIAESHLSLHTWPEARYAAVDIFTCGGLDPRPGVRAVEARLGATGARWHEILRGVPVELEAGAALVPADVALITRLVPARDR